MFGLTVEKLVLVAICSAVIIGPHRVPEYARRLSATLRQATTMMAEVRRRAEEDTGIALARDDWRMLDPRQYDPRRIIRDAWVEVDAHADAEAEETAVRPAPEVDSASPDAPAAPAAGRWVVSGSSAHPCRVWEPDDRLDDGVVTAASS